MIAKREKKIALSRVYMDDEIKRNVLKVLDSGQYILGRECKAFEEEFARFIGTKYAVLAGSGTAAIWLSLISLGVNPGDEIIVPSHTAFPTVEPILNLKAKPVFVDIDDYLSWRIVARRMEQSLRIRWPVQWARPVAFLSILQRI